jgi:uncharacterized protein YaiE (UPF0345 family)
MEYATLISEEDVTETGMHRNYHADNTGTGFNTHSHSWSHTVTCTQGSIKVTIDGVDTTVVPGDAAFEMPANSEHSLEVLTDGTEFYTEHPIDLSGYDHGLVTYIPTI